MRSKALIYLGQNPLLLNERTYNGMNSGMLTLTTLQNFLFIKRTTAWYNATFSNVSLSTFRKVA
jgi:hypothetical protein